MCFGRQKRRRKILRNGNKKGGNIRNAQSWHLPPELVSNILLGFSSRVIDQRSGGFFYFRKETAGLSAGDKNEVSAEGFFFVPENDMISLSVPSDMAESGASVLVKYQWGNEFECNRQREINGAPFFLTINEMEKKKKLKRGKKKIPHHHRSSPRKQKHAGYSVGIQRVTIHMITVKKGGDIFTKEEAGWAGGRQGNHFLAID